MSNEALRWAWLLPLKPGLKLVLVRLADMANDNKTCWPKQSTIAEETGLSRATVCMNLKKLEQLGLISQKRQRYKDGRMRSSSYTLLIQNKSLPCKNSQHGELRHCETLQHHVIKPNNKNPHGEPSYEDICKVSSETSPHSSMHDDAFADTQKSKLGTHESIPLQQNDLVVEIFEYWKSVMKHPRAKLDLPRKRKIQSALNLEYSVEQLKVAIDGCANTPFNMGQNEQKKRYDGIQLIFRDAEHIERFIGNTPINNKTNSKDTVSQIDQLAEGAI